MPKIPPVVAKAFTRIADSFSRLAGNMQVSRVANTNASMRTYAVDSPVAGQTAGAEGGQSTVDNLELYQTAPLTEREQVSLAVLKAQLARLDPESDFSQLQFDSSLQRIFNNLFRDMQANGDSQAYRLEAFDFLNQLSFDELTLSPPASLLDQVTASLELYASFVHYDKYQRNNIGSSYAQRLNRLLADLGAFKQQKQLLLSRYVGLQANYAEEIAKNIVLNKLPPDKLYVQQGQPVATLSALYQAPEYKISHSINRTVFLNPSQQIGFKLFNPVPRFNQDLVDYRLENRLNAIYTDTNFYQGIFSRYADIKPVVVLDDLYQQPPRLVSMLQFPLFANAQPLGKEEKIPNEWLEQMKALGYPMKDIKPENFVKVPAGLGQDNKQKYFLLPIDAKFIGLWRSNSLRSELVKMTRPMGGYDSIAPSLGEGASAYPEIQYFHPENISSAVGDFLLPTVLLESTKL